VGRDKRKRPPGFPGGLVVIAVDVELVHLGLLVSSWRRLSKRPEIFPTKAHVHAFSAVAEYECMGLRVWIWRVMASEGVALSSLKCLRWVVKRNRHGRRTLFFVTV